VYFENEYNLETTFKAIIKKRIEQHGLKILNFEDKTLVVRIKRKNIFPV
jgi:hypothetical protein